MAICSGRGMKTLKIESKRVSYNEKCHKIIDIMTKMSYLCTSIKEHVP